MVYVLPFQGMLTRKVPVAEPTLRVMACCSLTAPAAARSVSMVTVPDSVVVLPVIVPGALVNLTMNL